jgi:flagellar biosynthesis/type III secretory pathway chaperone
MASLGKEILEQEVEHLELLHGLMQEERECLARMDRETLLRLTKEKEALVIRMRRLHARREGLIDEDRSSLSRAPGTSDLFRTRNALIRELRDLGQTQKEIVETQKEQVGHLLAFLQNLRYQATTYDRKGTLNRR